MTLASAFRRMALRGMLAATTYALARLDTLTPDPDA